MAELDPAWHVKKKHKETTKGKIKKSMSLKSDGLLNCIFWNSS
jgi:hypothetical protein